MHYLTVGLLVAYEELLGRPRPWQWEALRRDAERAEVVAFDVDWGEAIYLLLQLPARKERRLYKMPWDDCAAGGLTRAASERRTVIMIRPLFFIKKFNRQFSPIEITRLEERERLRLQKQNLDRMLGPYRCE